MAGHLDIGGRVFRDYDSRNRSRRSGWPPWSAQPEAVTPTFVSLMLQIGVVGQEELNHCAMAVQRGVMQSLLNDHEHRYNRRYGT